jgi:hypothetical protein
MPQPPDPQLAQIIELLAEIKELLVQLYEKTSRRVTQTNCPVCNKTLSEYNGPYPTRADGLLVHKHCYGGG